MPFVLAGIRVKHDDPAIAISVGNVDFISFRFINDFCGPPEVLQVVATVVNPLFTELENELSLFVELEDLSVLVTVSADPDIAFVIDSNSVVALRPFVSFARPSPTSNKAPGLVEFQNWRSDLAADTDGWCEIGGLEIVFDSSRPMNDPHVILRIHRQADRRSLYPVVRQWLRPVWIDFKDWRLRRCAILRGDVWRSQGLEQVESAGKGDQGQADSNGPEFHCCLQG